MDKFFTDKKVTFNQLLQGDGYGYIYDSDIDVWLGLPLENRKRDEIKNELYKVKEILDGKSIRKRSKA